MNIEVTTYHLEMTDPEDLIPKQIERDDLEIRQAEIPSPELNRFLYTAVGGDWYWVDRLNWTYEEWRDWVAPPRLQTWVARISGTPAGYFELRAQEGGSMEITSFGLLPQFIGQGLGGHLLSAAIQTAWNAGASRVWVHTCTLDHPVALANYQARGLRIFRVETHTEDMPEKTPGPWPGARRAP